MKKKNNKKLKMIELKYVCTAFACLKLFEHSSNIAQSRIEGMYNSHKQNIVSHFWIGTSFVL